MDYALCTNPKGSLPSGNRALCVQAIGEGAARRRGLSKTAWQGKHHAEKRLEGGRISHNMTLRFFLRFAPSE